MKRMMIASSINHSKYIKGEVFSKSNKGKITWWNIYSKFTGTDGQDWIVLVKANAKEVLSSSLFCLQGTYISNDINDYNTVNFNSGEFGYSSIIEQSQYLKDVIANGEDYSTFKLALWCRFGVNSDEEFMNWLTTRYGKSLSLPTY